MLTVLRSLFRDKRGVTAVEYGLIAAAIAVLIIAGIRGIGGGVSTTFGTISSSI